MRKCFFVTPIGDKGSKVRIHSDQVLRHLLKPVCSELDFDPIRVDKIAKTSVLTDDIFNHLKDDDLVIVDITDHNPNVFLNWATVWALVDRTSSFRTVNIKQTTLLIFQIFVSCLIAWT